MLEKSRKFPFGKGRNKFKADKWVRNGLENTWKKEWNEVVVVVETTRVYLSLRNSKHISSISVRWFPSFRPVTWHKILEFPSLSTRILTCTTEDRRKVSKGWRKILNNSFRVSKRDWLRYIYVWKIIYFKRSIERLFFLSSIYGRNDNGDQGINHIRFLLNRVGD